MFLHSHGSYGMLTLLCSCLACFFIQSSAISQDGGILLRIKHADWIDKRDNLRDWNSYDENPCRWRGIECNSLNSVVAVDLSSASISGNLTSALCNLENLTALILHGNKFGGPFPHGLLECKRLEVLDLSLNQFTGNLPNRIYELRELRVLKLADNCFSGFVPAGFGMLSKIEALFFHNNGLNGAIPAFLGSLTKLTNLTFGDNPLLPGLIPFDLSHLNRLQQLWLYNCSRIGKIPDFLGNFTQLELLDLSKNNLYGDIPSRLMALSKLRELSLCKNKLSGRIPPNMGELKMLSKLDLSANQLIGQIPNGVANLTGLDLLSLSENRLTGPIPVGIGELPYLTDLELLNNGLTGMLPPSLGAHSNLIYIDIGGNKLEGPLPEAVCRGNVLYSLGIQSNSFNGSLPSSLEDCTSLHYVRIENNQLSGEIPLGLWTAPNLQWLFVGNNKFQGQIPPAIGKNLTFLDVSSNNFSGRIPAEVGQIRNLKNFTASNNKLSGLIPDQVADLSSLTTLRLDHNLLSGEIPKDIAALKSLNELNLAHNQLAGEIPGSLSSWQSLTSLDLSDNLLSGKIPTVLESLKFGTINVSDNRLSGMVPAALDISAQKDCFANNPGLCGGQYLGLPSCRPNSDQGKLVFRRFAPIVVPAVLLSAVALCLVLFCCLRYFYWRKPNSALSWKLVSFHSSLEFDESYILENMKESNLIGSGGSGKVYKVTLRNHGVVAVKKIQNKVVSGRQRRKVQQENDELEVEVETLGVIRHRNILKLLCRIESEEADFKLLVYDYMPNGSLYDRLHAVQSPEMALKWPLRYEIALGAARGLSYMHHDCSPPILHRDVKSTNILLDSDFHPKIADFGLCRLLQNLGDSYVASGYVGSHGYIAPEYASSLKVSWKSDVYSFGVVLLELVSGKKATGEVEFGEGLDIVGWIRRSLCRGGGEERVLDRRVASSESVEQMLRMLRMGLVCTQRSPQERPSMREVVEMLGMYSQHPHSPFGAASSSPALSSSPLEESDDISHCSEDLQEVTWE